MRVFIDTEFTDLAKPELISLGLAAETGEECYIEVLFEARRCTDFVRNVVIPLLGKDPDAFCPRNDLRLRILEWLGIVKGSDPIQICYDSPHDWDLFNRALDGQVPGWIEPMPLKSSDINELLLYSYFRRHPDESEHHALSDAKANLYAYRPR
ncbi:hypothetical protein [Noviherbaspirillum pedocola]|uniref:Uncharacterized protein n=1 Tax=Noviherbaspirillum pedocola TaxID=2801341 RepID=A0A934W9M8_9BURK|nr:hypothetical protein [Noviherbaspirillum pedocola]MBK4737304.1 hypothetical protein [Noviherbaspirillum pedocola]